MLEIEHIFVGYGKVNVIHDLSLTIQQGEIVSVLGPNGAGKTTLVRSILGLTPISSGEVRFCGEQIHRLKPHQIVARGIVVVPEGRGIFPKMTIEENLKTGYVFLENDKSLLLEGMENAYSRFPILGQRRKQLAGTLSGGEQTMLAVSRAMMRKPKLLLMDEPMASLDPSRRTELGALLQRLTTSGRTLLVTTHDEQFARDFATRVLTIDGGSVREGCN